MPLPPPTSVSSVCFISGWYFLAPSIMWRHKCSPAALLSPCWPAQPLSGRWGRSWLPRGAWQRVRPLARCWHVDANKPASPGWCTGPFPGHSALMLWVLKAWIAVRQLTCMSFPLHHLLHVDLFPIFLFHRFSLSGQQWKKEESPSVNPEGSTSGPKFRCHICCFVKNVVYNPDHICSVVNYDCSNLKMTSTMTTSESQHKQNQNERWK